MKKLINVVGDVVKEQLEGLAVAHSDVLKVHYEPNYVYRADAPVAGKVAIVSGGGSGHEPMHAGFVGMGMLDGACPGDVFISPTPDQIVECAKAVDSGEGVLFIVKNYSTDVMNFEMAAEMAAADGMKIQNILLDDDVAVEDSLYTAGRRGLGTTVLAEKIVGAAAEAGYNLDQCAVLCRKVNQYGRSMGVALSAGIVPSTGNPTFDLDDDEFELGIGIHGEPGRKRLDMTTADEITEMVTLTILGDGSYTRIIREWDAGQGAWYNLELTDDPFEAGDQVIAFVNGMGGTPVSELYIVYRKLAEICEARGMVIVRNLIGSYITSLEMKGFSITLLRTDEEVLNFWDAPVNTPGMRKPDLRGGGE
jgi:dihydroxyacetone kinase-like protein